MSKRAEEAANKYIGHPFEPDEDSAITLARSSYFQGYEQAEKDLSDKAKYSSGWDGFYYGKGYEQAEKDIIAIIESRLSELLGDAQPTPILRAELWDLIKKIKEE